MRSPGRHALLLLATLLGPSGSGAAPDRSPEPDARRDTPHEDAPRRLGARFDDDAHLPTVVPVQDVTLDATLDPVTHRVRATGTLRWRNTARVPVTELWFHLYLNAFKNDRSLFLRSPFGASRSGRTRLVHGGIEIERLAVREHGPEDRWPLAERRLADDPEDETLARLPLPAPAEPGAVLHLDFSMTAALPSVVERTGFVDSFHLVAQWFPKLCRLEPDGTWRRFRFHPQAEFFSDFGDYSVTLRVPAGFRVGATGQRVREEIEDGVRVGTYRAAGVHDFAWTAWDRFEHRSATLDGVEVEVLHPRGHERNATETLDAVANALPFFGRALGRYPYPTLTIVHPPARAAAAGGMEYPTFLTTGGHWALGAATGSVRVVTVHELAHQWFQGMVATDEPRHPFLDEGLTTTLEALALARFGGWQERWLAEVRRVSGNAAAPDAVVAAPADAFTDFRELGALVYARTADLLLTLAAIHGEDRLLQALGRYARAYRYSHPEPRHLLAAVEETLGAEAREQLALGLFDRATVDYLVRDLECVPLLEPGGHFAPAGLPEVLVAVPRAATGQTACRAVIVRRGSLRFPVEIELCDEAGRCERRSWDGRGSTHVVHVTARSPLASVTVDPDRRIRVDGDRTNDAARRRPAGTPRLEVLLTAAAAAALRVLGP